ncbi:MULTISPECIES: VHS domain-containing protein [Prochlorococcus]|uniref:VHS domain-containing protein n=1 Tax=Prochlorococcus TaxID=1218 RepID=UPI000533AA15|nr:MULTISPECIES: VHS domain-containing protein [Prochlorococcus]KGG12576.1 hypothetical protein EV05_1788 [Prochlorococcus sp. MIT 0601]
MERSWKKSKEEWLGSTILSKEISLWALAAVAEAEKEIYSLEASLETNEKDLAEKKAKCLKRTIKNEFVKIENSLDDLSLSTPNSYKLQVSIPASLNYLMKAWAAAEGRDLSSVALQCLETGLRAIQSKGSIPSAAMKRYDIACERRIALAEINNALENYESILVER